MAELSLPECLVCAAESAIRGAAIDVAEFPLGDKAYGYVADMARMAAAAVIDVLTEDMKAHDGAGHAAILRMLALAVADVPALEGGVT